ncbi:MAG: lipocalin family protein [Planctomycetota bacterium]
MQLRTLTPLALIALLLMSPALLLADDHGHAIHGKWEMRKIEGGGEVEEIDPGMFIVEFMPDGTMKTYEGEEEGDSGRYKIEGDKLTVYLAGDEEGEESTIKIEGDVMSVTQEIVPGENFVVTLNRIVDN